MTIPIPENSITINGEIYVLVDDEESDECLRCALRGRCDTQNLLCQILDDAPQGRRFEKMDVKTSPWKTIINGNPVPDTGRPVVGYWICGPEPFIEMVTHDPESGEWQDLADRVEMQRAHIARIEAGRYSVGLDTLTAIGQALGKRLAFV